MTFPTRPDEDYKPRMSNAAPTTHKCWADLDSYDYSNLWFYDDDEDWSTCQKDGTAPLGLCPYHYERMRGE